jgi:alpha-glucoside transport system substrate-binding protein
VESAEIRGVSKIQLALDRRYAALISGDVTVAEAPPPRIEQPDNPWTDGRDLSGTTVTVTGAFINGDAELFRASMNHFEEETGIQVSYQGSPRFEEEVLERLDGGDPPDAVIIPQPGLAAELVGRGAVHDIREWFGSSYLAEQYDKMWRDCAEIGGIQSGVWYRASVKSIVWYNRPIFERNGYAIPETWEDLLSLSDRIVADGYTPWSIAIESGHATGWPATDWIEDIMLRLHTPDVYDRWVAGELPFDSPEVREAFDYLGDIWFRPGWVFGGRQGIVETWFGNGILPLTQTPPEAVLHRQAHFMTGFMPEGGAEVGETIGYFYLPPIDPAMGRPVLGSGDMISALTDRPEVRAFMRYVSQGISTREWVEHGGFISPHDDTPLAWYSSDTDSGIAAMLRHATVFRFDGSDLMPPAVGAGQFWRGITEYVRDDDADLRQILRSIDAAYP